MLSLMEDARVQAADGHAAWSESFTSCSHRWQGFSRTPLCAGTGGRTCWGCSRKRSGRRHGSWRSSPGTCRRTGCSAC